MNPACKSWRWEPKPRPPGPVRPYRQIVMPAADSGARRRREGADHQCRDGRDSWDSEQMESIAARMPVCGKRFGWCRETRTSDGRRLVECMHQHDPSRPGHIEDQAESTWRAMLVFTASMAERSVPSQAPTARASTSRRACRREDLSRGLCGSLQGARLECRASCRPHQLAVSSRGGYHGREVCEPADRSIGRVWPSRCSVG